MLISSFDCTGKGRSLVVRKHAVGQLQCTVRYAYAPSVERRSIVVYGGIQEFHVATCENVDIISGTSDLSKFARTVICELMR